MPDRVPDTTRVRAFLREHCPVAQVDRLELTYMKMEREGRARFLYETREAGSSGLRVSARQVPAGSPHEAAASLLYSADLQLIFQVFPADEALHSLRTLTDAEAMAQLLQSALEVDGHGAALRELAVQVVRYKPERKCVLRYDLTWTTESGLPRVVYAKVLRPVRVGRTPRLLASLRESTEAPGFDLPEPLGVLPELAAELYARVPGTPLSVLSGSAEFPQICRRVGAALRKFHRLRVPGLPGPDLRARIARLERAAAGIRLLVPAVGERIGRLRDQLGRRLQDELSIRSCLVHGDFHGDNVMVEGGRVALVDLDDCADGDPAQDLGSLWAQLDWLSLKGVLGPQLLVRGRRAFLDGYREDGPDQANDAVAVQAALHCVLFAYQCLRHAPTQTDQALGLLAACEVVLAQGLA